MSSRPSILRADAYALGPNGPPVGWSADIVDPHTVTTIVRLFDEAGTEGIGATCSYTEGAYDLSVLETLGALVPTVVRHPPTRTEALAQQLRRRPLPTVPGASSALDVAMWDLAAKQAQLPLFEYLGGTASTLRAYGSTPFLGTVERYLQTIEDLRAAGIRGVKLHAWSDAERDLEFLTTVHQHFGDGTLSLMLDAEERYDRRGALRVARHMEQLGCLWLEAPLDDHDLRGYQELRRQVDVDILGSGNWVWELPEVLVAIHDATWDVLHFDVTVAGGITAGRKLMALAEAGGLSVELQSWGHTLVQAANLHLALAAGRSGWFEYPLPAGVHETAVLEPIRPDADGNIHAPNGLGIGIELDWDEVVATSLASRAWGELGHVTSTMPR